MGHAIYISPVGTSLLHNFARDRGRAFTTRYADLGDWPRLSPSDERNAYPDGSVCRALEDRELVEALVDYSVELGGKSCAEVNGILGIQKLFGHRFSDVELHLLYTRTCNARLVTYALREVFSRLGLGGVVPVELRGTASVDEFDRGLVEVLDRVSSIVRSGREKGCRIYVNATPGFKAEAAFVMLISLLLGVDGVVYIHESFDQPVLIPYLPLSLRIEELGELLGIFGVEGSVHVNALLSAIPYEKLLDYRERGLIVIEGEYSRLRPWVRALVEKLSRGREGHG